MEAPDVENMNWEHASDYKGTFPLRAAVTFGNVIASGSSQEVGILQRWREWHGGTVQKTDWVRLREGRALPGRG